MSSKYGAQNNVSADNQLPSEEYVCAVKNNGKQKVLFVGNSITKHAPSAQIGWYGNWGMAASAEDKDYVHLVVNALNEKIATDYCIAQCSVWERNFKETDSLLPKYFEEARDFNADIIIIRIGENINSSCDLSELKCNFEKMISYFCKNKNAKIIISNLFWEKAEINKIIEDVAESNNYIFCDIADLENDTKMMAIGLYEHHGVSVHPSDYGMKRIAQKILDCLNNTQM